eukprot:TRINITY_DN13150_c0_g1_i1.p1 TRINITY_DN13150_c0_g1~~TRINITY_DN13150_c0_g1_i1.p1  ORF type:complete len:124 (+),score=17.70 TRINITY_DN13150_c0_g1_i1:34-405(+)
MADVVLSIQFLIWSVSGAYMVIFDIDYIHGDSLIKKHESYLNSQQITYSMSELYRDFPKAENVSVGLFMNQAVYRFKQIGLDENNREIKQKYLLSALNGIKTSPLSESKAVEVARYYYSGEGR